MNQTSIATRISNLSSIQISNPILNINFSFKSNNNCVLALRISCIAMDIEDIISKWLGLMSGKPEHTLHPQFKISASEAQAAADAIANFLAIVALQVQEPITTNRHNINIFINRFITILSKNQISQYYKNMNISHQPTIKSVGKNLFLIITILTHFCQAVYANHPSYKIRQIIDYEMSFSKDSNVTLLFTSCGALLDLKQSVLSFFFYNTFPLKRMILVDRCQASQIDLRNALPKNNLKYKQLFTIITFNGTQLEGFQKAFEIIDTKYVMNLANKWITFDGYGYIQQAIDAIQYGEKNGIKISQATTLFPTWRNYRALANYRKSDLGTVFYEIRNFKPTLRYYFTLNPSLINFQDMFEKIIKKDLKSFCDSKQCKGLADRDCCQRQLGEQLYEVNHYIQIFIDDGSVNANVFRVD